jgi:hypothetical protein
MSAHPNASGTAWHVPERALRRYMDGPDGPGSLPSSSAASVEAHLDGCAACCWRLAPGAADAELLQRIGGELAGRIERTPQYRRPRRWYVRILAGAPFTWMLAVLAVTGAADALDLVGRAMPGTRPSLLLLISPILPLSAVAAAWAPRLDPMHELTATTPAAGLSMVLRRGLFAVLIAMAGSAGVQVLGAAVPPALWLLPCLTLTAVSLALGSVIPLHRAAVAVVAGWTAVVVLPGLVAWSAPVPGTLAVPALLRPSALPAWAVLSVAALAVVVLRRREYQRAVRPSRWTR